MYWQRWLKLLNTSRMALEVTALVVIWLFLLKMAVQTRAESVSSQQMICMKSLVRVRVTSQPHILPLYYLESIIEQEMILINDIQIWMGHLICTWSTLFHSQILIYNDSLTLVNIFTATQIVFLIHSKIMDVIQFIINKMVVKSRSIFSILFFAALLKIATPLVDSTNTITSYVDPSPACSAFCMYTINSVFNLQSQCAFTSYGTNDYCKMCDTLLFRPVTGSAGFFQCIPHQYNSERLVTKIVLSYQLGYTTSGWDYSVLSNYNTKWVNNYQYTYATLPAHYALRVRFSVYLYRYDIANYIYPLYYSIDSETFLYNQTLDKYWSEYDIITSSLINHTSTTVTLSFRNDGKGNLANTHSNTGCNLGATDGTCYCSYSYYDGVCGVLTRCSTASVFTCCGGCHTDGPSTTTCCDKRYIQINDLLLFASVCQTGCLSCSSATYCKTCDHPNGYYLNPTDHLCYTTCPQATYKNDTYPFLNTSTYNGIASTNPEYWCLTCNNTCLQCVNLTYCKTCYAYGRNESFLFNNTCVNPCPNGYVGNYTNHTCYCPLDYHYEVNTVIIMMCYPCAIECIRCTSYTNLDCTVCEKGFYLANLTTHCLNSCPDGQFKNQVTRTCYNCDISCSSCDIHSTQCTKCFFTSVKKYLLGNECLTWCPDGYAWNNVTRTCDICNLYYYSYEGTCIRFCPSMYIAHDGNRSCIHYSKTDYTFNVQLESVNVLSHGKLLKFAILLQDGLSVDSRKSLLATSYSKIQIVYKDTKIDALLGVRKLFDTTLPIRNVEISNNYIYYYTLIPDDLNYQKSFQIIFLQSLTSQQNITYSNTSSIIVINQQPQLIKQYYLYSAKNQFNLIMIPLLILVLFLIILQLKGVYEMYIQCLRVVQIVGLLVFSSFPVGQYIYYFLVGFSYFNLDFIPNLYATMTNPQYQVNLVSYFLTTEDMDFIRLNGSVILFGVIWAFALLISKCLFGIRQSQINYMVKFGSDIMEVKILHSFWSSLLFLIVNYNSSNYIIFITFCFACLFFIAVLGRRYTLWLDTKDVSPFFIWRMICTLLICFVSLANELLIGLIFVVSVVIVLWQFWVLHSDKYLVHINDLTSMNYMEQRTYKILNTFDQQISYSWSISLRNLLLVIFPLITSILISTSILLKSEENQIVIFNAVVLYFFFLLVVANTVLICLFLEERRRYLVQNKLEYLQKKYSKLNNQTIVYSQRKRPRVKSQQKQAITIIDEEKYLDQPERSMMKTFD